MCPRHTYCTAGTKHRWGAGAPAAQWPEGSLGAAAPGGAPTLSTPRVKSQPTAPPSIGVMREMAAKAIAGNPQKTAPWSF